jgi:hypothetical protein
MSMDDPPLWMVGTMQPDIAEASFAEPPKQVAVREDSQFQGNTTARILKRR